MPDILGSAFQRITSALIPERSVTLYPHQRAVAEALLSGRRVVLRAPSGSGKSLAAWFPWLASRLQRHDFPPTLLHVLPGGTFFTDQLTRLHTAAESLGHLQVGVQTEGDAFDPFFLSDAVITTVDQLMSVALHRPLGLHPGLANINAGALLGSYLAFDEFPALLSRDALALWLGLLRRYLPITPCLFTGSALPRPVFARIAEALDADYIDASSFDAGGRRGWTLYPPLAAGGILRQHRARTIIICNTVRGAQMLYRTLQRAMVEEGSVSELYLLHQYQFYRDRVQVDRRVAEIFRPGGAGDAILITTSGLEIGSDYTADTLITDPAPPESLLRRAGRCARFPGEQGQVVVARVTEPLPGDTYPAPPGESLARLLADGAPHTFAEELAALDTVWAQAMPVHQPDILRNLPDVEEIDETARRLMALGESFPERLFPRVGACLHRMPETVQDPFELERFSLSVSSLERGWRQWQASGCPGEWFSLIPRWPQNEEQTPAWTLVDNPRDFRAAVRLVVLNAEAVSYDPIIGLELAPGTSYQSERLVVQHTAWTPFDQHVQRYEEHAARCLAAYGQLAPWFRYVLRHLGLRWAIPVLELDQWLRLCVLWHDAGKLTADWQRAAYRWQTEVIRRPAPEGVLARLDYQSRRDRRFPCPPHAQISGQVLYQSLAALMSAHPALLAGTVAALSHHHGTGVCLHGDLTPHPEAWGMLVELAMPLLDDRQLHRIDRCGWTLYSRSMPEIPARPPDDPEAWMAYSLLVRAIRLADREIALEEVLR